MKKPKLKTPPPPEIGFLDLDSPLFMAASAGEQVVYRALDENGDVIGEFESAHEFANWLEVCSEFTVDTEFGFEGDFDKIERETDYKIKDVEECHKAFDAIIERWVEQAGVDDWVGYISKASGEENFRYAVAKMKPYKGNRSGMRKPHHLEATRRYAKSHPKIKTARGSVEVDDVTCALAQRRGHKGCVVGVDKDARGVKNTHFFIPDEMDSPQFSSKKIVGRLYLNEKGEVKGYGDLFWLYQILAGDPVDNYGGCAKIGPAKAYKLLNDYDGVDARYLKNALETVCEAYSKAFGDNHEHKCAVTGEKIKRHWKDILEEMCQLAYMKKSQKDVCPYIEIVQEIYDESYC